MASGVNVKMGVSGVAQFKQSIQQAKQNMKTLDAQLALTEKQYKATGDAETYMQQKSEQLHAKLEEQKAIAANAEKALADMTERGVDKSSKAFQDMLRTLIQAKGDIIDTEDAINGITNAEEAAGDEADSMNHQLQRIGDGVNFQNVTDSLGKITDGMTNVMKQAWKMGEAIVNATLGAGSWADEIITTATQYEDTLNIFGGGASATETLQRMRKTANLIDTDVDTILSAQDKLKKNKEKQDKDAMGAWAYLGLDPNGKSDIDLFWKTGEAIAALGDEEDKVTYAQKLFGKSWRELLPLFKTGREEYEKTMQSWSVVEDDQLDNLGKMDDQYQKLQDEWETFKMELLETFSGPLTTGMEKITDLFKALNEYLDTPDGKAMLEQMGNTITQLINDLTNVSPEDVINGLKVVVESVKTSLEWISDHSTDVENAVKVFVGAWAGLEVAKGVSIALQLINGISGLTAGAAKAAGASAGTAWGGAFASAVMKASPFLVFLYELLNPAAGGDTIGDNTLLDENGNLTKEAEKYGYKLDENGEVYNAAMEPTGTKKYSDADIQKIQDFWDVFRSGEMTTKGMSDFRSRLLLPDDEYRELMTELNKFTHENSDWKTIEDLPADFFIGTSKRNANGINETVEQTDLGNVAGFRALDRMAEVAEDLNNEGSQDVKQAGKDISDAAEELKKLPRQTAMAVHDVINGMEVVVDGNTFTAIIGQVMATWVENQ